MRSYREWLFDDFQALQDDRRTLAAADNSLVREWKRRQIADRERLLSQLTPQERTVIERTVCNGERVTSLSKETGVSVREIVRLKEDAIEKLLQLRHGLGYRP